ncbi:MAG: restriction endonuclease subunit S [Paludibacteraceae bacterium]|nr:restriction endonuclease subunit S [Paludibacteraceae bacterium]
MKEGWKTNLLLKVCKVYQPQTIATSQLIPGAPYDVFGANGCIGKYDQYNHEEDEILLTCRGATCGNINRSTPKSWINGNAMVVHPISDNIIKDFLMYALKSIDFSKVITGAAQPQITRVSLASVTIPIPPLPEQERIVSLLDAEFAKIDAIKANAEKQLQDAKALFQSALKDYLTPKEGWEDGILGNIAYIVHGKNQKDVVDSLGKYPIYGSGGNVMGYANDCLCDEGTTILGRKGTINNPVYVNSKFWNVDTAFGICAKENVDKRFLFYIIKSEDWQARNTGTTLPSLTQTVVLSVPIFYPSLSDQQQIAEQLDNISAKIQSLQSNFDTTVTLCNDLKQSILKDIFG